MLICGFLKQVGLKFSVQGMTSMGNITPVNATCFLNLLNVCEKNSLELIELSCITKVGLV